MGKKQCCKMNEEEDRVESKAFIWAIKKKEVSEKVLFSVL